MSKQLVYRQILERILEKDTREVLPSRQNRLAALERIVRGELEDSAGQTLD